jgi:hypothetical protein
MDNSSIMNDNSQLKIKIVELIEDSRKMVEKRTFNIHKEVNKMREECEGIISKCKIEFLTW